MNSSNDYDTARKADELNQGFLQLNQLDKIGEDLEFNEENVVTELNEVAILSESKISLKKESENKANKKKNKFEKCFEKLPLKGFILATLCAVFNSIAAIFTKLVTEFSGKS